MRLRATGCIYFLALPEILLAPLLARENLFQNSNTLLLSRQSSPLEHLLMDVLFDELVVGNDVEVLVDVADVFRCCCC